MRVLLQNADMSACWKMPCVLIFPTKWKKQQINKHTSCISANLAHANTLRPSLQGAVTCVLYTGDAPCRLGRSQVVVWTSISQRNSLLSRWQEVRYLARVIIIRVTRAYTTNDVKCKARIWLWKSIIWSNSRENWWWRGCLWQLSWRQWFRQKWCPRCWTLPSEVHPHYDEGPASH